MCFRYYLNDLTYVEDPPKEKKRQRKSKSNSGGGKRRKKGLKVKDFKKSVKPKNNVGATVNKIANPDNEDYFIPEPEFQG